MDWLTTGVAWVIAAAPERGVVGPGAVHLDHRFGVDAVVVECALLVAAPPGSVRHAARIWKRGRRGVRLRGCAHAHRMGVGDGGGVDCEGVRARTGWVWECGLWVRGFGGFGGSSYDCHRDPWVSPNHDVTSTHLRQRVRLTRCDEPVGDPEEEIAGPVGRVLVVQRRRQVQRAQRNQLHQGHKRRARVQKTAPRRVDPREGWWLSVIHWGVLRGGCPATDTQDVDPHVSRNG